MKYSFRNDYNQIGHPKLIETLLVHANDINVGYGFDDITINLEKKMRNLLKEDVDMYLFSGGTQTNMTLLSKVLMPYEAVIAIDSGHINVHETGAVEGTGHKIITVKGFDGKVTPEDVLNVLSLHGDCHMVKPRAVYISNSTEIGSIYQKQELIDLYNICLKHNLYLFLDGARLPVALTCEENDLTIQDLAKYTDAFYVGGNKNGMPLGEMLLIKNNDIKKDFRYHLKNKGAMLSKTFMLAYLFDAYFENDFYLELASNTNKTAKYLKNKLIENKLEIVYPNPTNQIFVKLDNKLINKLEESFDFEVWEKGSKETVIRLVTCFNTSYESIDILIDALNKGV